MHQNWPDKSFPFVNFVFPYDGHFGEGGAEGVRGGGGGDPSPCGKKNEAQAGGGGGAKQQQWHPGLRLRGGGVPPPGGAEFLEAPKAPQKILV